MLVLRICGRFGSVVSVDLVRLSGLARAMRLV